MNLQRPMTISNSVSRLQKHQAYSVYIKNFHPSIGKKLQKCLAIFPLSGLASPVRVPLCPSSKDFSIISTSFALYKSHVSQLRGMINPTLYSKSIQVLEYSELLVIHPCSLTLTITFNDTGEDSSEIKIGYLLIAQMVETHG